MSKKPQGKLKRPTGTCAACGHAGGLHYGPEGVCVADCRSLNPLIQCGCRQFVPKDTAELATIHAKPDRLTSEQADAIEAEMRRLEDDPGVTKRALRLFMQHLMPCGHAAGNLLTCPTPPFGCVICNGEDRP